MVKKTNGEPVGVAETIARLLFPGAVHDGSDCRNEIGREGQPCRICAASAEEWANTIEKVKAALLAASPAGNEPVAEPLVGETIARLDAIAQGPVYGGTAAQAA